MIEPTLLFGAFFSILSASIYLLVGRTLSRRRPASHEASVAWSLFVVWWYALAASTFSGAATSLLGALGAASLPLFVTFNHANFLALCTALYGLMFYLLYLFTGNYRLLGPLAVFYTAYYLLLIYFTQSRFPIDVTVGRWNAGLVFEKAPSGPLFTLALILLVFPQILGSLAYFTLYFRVKNATQKYRILLVSWSIIIWFASALLATLAGVGQQDWWQVASRLIGLGAALTILIAYQPPFSIQRRFGVTPITEERSASTS